MADMQAVMSDSSAERKGETGSAGEGKAQAHPRCCDQAEPVMKRAVTPPRRIHPSEGQADGNEPTLAPRLGRPRHSSDKSRALPHFVKVQWQLINSSPRAERGGHLPLAVVICNSILFSCWGGFMRGIKKCLNSGQLLT